MPIAFDRKSLLLGSVLLEVLLIAGCAEIRDVSSSPEGMAVSVSRSIIDLVPGGSQTLRLTSRDKLPGPLQATISSLPAGVMASTVQSSKADEVTVVFRADVAAKPTKVRNANVHLSYGIDSQIDN